MDSITSWTFWLVCPDCGSGDFDHGEPMGSHERMAQAVATCTGCHRRWIISTTLRPET